MSDSESPLEPQESVASDRLDSWKEIATYLGREVRTVRRWENAEGLPVHRHVHNIRATVYAYEAELEEWLKGRDVRKQNGEPTSAAKADRRRPLAYGLAIAGAAVLIAIAYLFSMGPAGFGLGKSAAGGLADGTSEDPNHDPQYTVLFADSPPNLTGIQTSFDISASGDRGVFYELRAAKPPQLYIYEQSGSVVRPLLNDLGPWVHFHSPVWSPSDNLIAYVAVKPELPRSDAVDEDRNQVAALFVVSPDGGTPRQIGTTMRQVNGLCWTLDGQGLTYIDPDKAGVHTVSLDDGGIKTVPVDTTELVIMGGYSPDGRWLAVKIQTDKQLGEHYEIRLLSTTGGEAVSLTTLSGIMVNLTWSPDSRSIYYPGPEASERNIWKLSLDPKTGAMQGDPEQVTFFSGASAINPKFIDGGRRIAFYLWRLDYSIHVADAASPTESRSVARGRMPKLSPDGQVIYYRTIGRPETELFAVPRDGGTPVRLAESVRREFDLSPDGSTLAYIRTTGSGASLFTVSTRGGEPRLLHEFEGNTELPRWVAWTVEWSPDGSLLAYAHGTGLYVIPADGGTPKRLAEMPKWGEGTLRWSPDGEFIAALGYPDGQEGNNNVVFVVPVAGGEPRQLTSAEVYKEGLEWHPDGQRLTYHVSRWEDSETRQVFLDGRPPSLLVNQPGRGDHWGKWAPDGRSFYFESYSRVGPLSEAAGTYVYDDATGDTSLFAYFAEIPTWSRDGKTMAWGTVKTTSQIWIMSDFD